MDSLCGVNLIEKHELIDHPSIAVRVKSECLVAKTGILVVGKTKCKILLRYKSEEVEEVEDIEVVEEVEAVEDVEVLEEAPEEAANADFNIDEQPLNLPQD